MNSPTSKKPMTKTEMIAALAESTGLERKQVVSLFDELAKLIEKELVKKGRHHQHLQPVEGQSRSQARHSRTPGHQSFHERGDGFQGQARQECGQAGAVERIEELV